MMIREGDRVYALGVGNGTAIQQLEEEGWHEGFNAYTAYILMFVDKDRPNKERRLFAYKLNTSDCPEEEEFE